MSFLSVKKLKSEFTITIQSNDPEYDLETCNLQIKQLSNFLMSIVQEEQILSINLSEMCIPGDQLLLLKPVEHDFDVSFCGHFKITTFNIKSRFEQFESQFIKQNEMQMIHPEPKLDQKEEQVQEHSLDVGLKNQNQHQMQHQALCQNQNLKISNKKQNWKPKSKSEQKQNGKQNKNGKQDENLNENRNKQEQISIMKHSNANTESQNKDSIDLNHLVKKLNQNQELRQQSKEQNDYSELSFQPLTNLDEYTLTEDQSLNSYSDSLTSRLFTTIVNGKILIWKNLSLNKQLISLQDSVHDVIDEFQFIINFNKSKESIIASKVKLSVLNGYKVFLNRKLYLNRINIDLPTLKKLFELSNDNE